MQRPVPVEGLYADWKSDCSPKTLSIGGLLEPGALTKMHLFTVFMVWFNQSPFLVPAGLRRGGGSHPGERLSPEEAFPLGSFTAPATVNHI